MHRSFSCKLLLGLWTSRALICGAHIFRSRFTHFNGSSATLVLCIDRGSYRLSVDVTKQCLSLKKTQGRPCLSHFTYTYMYKFAGVHLLMLALHPSLYLHITSPHKLVTRASSAQGWTLFTRLCTSVGHFTQVSAQEVTDCTRTSNAQGPHK